MRQLQRAILALEDGTVFEGRSFGFPGEKAGEVVFNTSMTGYQEILTDPSYRGQIVVMTYPLIGNYGVNEEDIESKGPKVEGFIIKENSLQSSNWRSQGNLSGYLIDHQIMGVDGIDTRALTKHIRSVGAMKAIVSTEDLDPDSLVHKARISPGLIGRDLVKEVTCREPYQWEEANDPSLSNHDEARHPRESGNPEEDWIPGQARNDKPENIYLAVHNAHLPPSAFHFRPRVVAIDYGIKYNILRSLRDWNCEVFVVPASSDAVTILSREPDGILLSNGPGDPEGVPYAISTVRQLIGRKPIFGICLGHQLLGLAMGGKTFKLKFGHRGANQPVKDLKTGRVMITSQNHGFCVDPNSLNPEEVEFTQINLNDQTLEGMRHKTHPVFSVQYHPEASPGPHDTHGLFGEFLKMMELYSGST